MKQSPRDRRLQADLQGLQQLQAESSIFRFVASGNPPQSYRLIFQGAGFRLEKDKVMLTDQHELVIELGAAYPRLSPNLAWRSPIFHPNISQTGVVCLGGYGTHWVPSLTLTELCHMLWDMIRYRNFDTESPYNREAALWAKHQQDFTFPIDNRPLRDKITRGQLVNRTPSEPKTQSAPASAPPVADIVFIDDSNDGSNGPSDLVVADIVDPESIEPESVRSESPPTIKPDIFFID